MSADDYRRDVSNAVREGHWTFWKILPLFLVALVVLSGVFFGLRAVGLIGEAAVDREVFEQTQSYVHGKNTHIARLRAEYETEKDVTAKEALRRLILEEASTIDEDKLSESNRTFVRRLTGNPVNQ